MRPIASALYGNPAERVIGSGFELSYREDPDGGALVHKAGIDFFDDGPKKPVRIWSRTGQRPALACGNSNGDVPMLRFAGGLQLLVVHDDGESEFDYTAGADRALAEGWTTISVKNDWATVFADAP
jgi:hypothetical protein